MLILKIILKKLLYFKYPLKKKIKDTKIVLHAFTFKSKTLVKIASKFFP